MSFEKPQEENKEETLEEESFDRVVGSSDYQQAEQYWREYIENEDWEKPAEIKEKSNDNNLLEHDKSVSVPEQSEVSATPKETKKLSEEESKESINQIFKEIESSIGEQPESVQKIVEEVKDKFKTFATIEGKDFIFTDINDGRLLALVRDENNGNKWKTRVFRISGSDHQWKSYPGKRKNGDIMKGDEENPLHHYVQSAKLDKNMYKMISSIPEARGFISRLSEYLPMKGERFEDEFEFKEDYLELKNKEWHKYQRYSQMFFNNYMYFSNQKKEDIGQDVSDYKVVKEISLSEMENGPQEFFKKMADAFEELYQNPETKKAIEENPQNLVRNFLDDLNNPNTPECFKVFAQKYHEGLSEFFEYGFASKFPGGCPESLIPDFSKEKIIDSYQKGDINIEEYEVKSPEGDNLVFSMAQDKKGRVYIDNIYDPRVGMNDYGTLNKICQMGHLVYKPEDYKEQVFGIPEKYIKPGSSENYVDISALWENIPIVKKYKQELAKRSSKY